MIEKLSILTWPKLFAVNSGETRPEMNGCVFVGLDETV